MFLQSKIKIVKTWAAKAAHVFAFGKFLPQCFIAKTLSQNLLTVYQIVVQQNALYFYRVGFACLSVMNGVFETVKGLSFHTLRVLIAKGEIQAFRTGENGRGRILVPKSSLLAYFDRL